MTFGVVGLGLATTLILGLFVPRILKIIRDKMEVPRIPGDEVVQTWWKKATEHPPVSGSWVGWTERIVLFYAVLLRSEEAVGIWVAFKLASKWEAWSNIGRLPDQLRGNSTVAEKLEYAAARRVWTAQNYCTFVVGTSLNFLCAFLGGYVSDLAFLSANEAVNYDCCIFKGM